MIQALGWIGNAAFFVRFLVQWLASERAKRTVAPRSFWWLSLVGTLALGTYTVAIGEPVLVAGYVINGLIYARNLRIEETARRRLDDLTLLAVAIAATALLFATPLIQTREDLHEAPAWFACSVLGQGLWSSRFVVQWWASERKSKSHFPISFWWLSLIGNTLLCAYAVHLGDAVLIAGYAINPFVQARNLVIAYRARRAAAAVAAPEPIVEITPAPRRYEGVHPPAQGSGRNAGGVPE